MGGALSLASACHVDGLSAVVPFYGLPPAEKVDYSKVTAPILVIHGERDNVVPIRFGEKLYAAIRSPKRFIRIAEAEHDLDRHDMFERVKDFLAGEERL